MTTTDYRNAGDALLTDDSSNTWDAGRAEELYRMSPENEDEEATAALIGLWILLDKKNPQELKACLSKAKEREATYKAALISWLIITMESTWSSQSVYVEYSFTRIREHSPYIQSFIG